ncbi:MAG: methylenetetrahydrofolate reductase, partial [Flavobacteriales bacterium]
MKITHHLEEAKSTLFSFELLPPLKGENIQKIHSTVENLLEFNPAFVDVTYHREEFVYHEVTKGL